MQQETHTIGTVSDRHIDPFAIKVEDINIWDIAWALSNQNRYAGHTPKPWSVLSHLGLVLQLYVHDKKGQVNIHESIWLLMHDASEAYLQDIIHPLKSRPEFAFYREVEAQVMAVIWRSLGYDPAEINQGLIERYDKQAKHIEMYKFFPDRRNLNWGIVPEVYDASPWYTRPISVAKVQDFVYFLREQVINAHKCPDVAKLFELSPRMETLLLEAEAETAGMAAAIAGAQEVKEALNDRIPIESNDILNARVS